MDIYSILTINFAPCVGLIFLFMFLLANTTLSRPLYRIFIALIALEFLELVLYSLELWTAGFPQPVFARILLSVLGYILRIVLIYLILLLTVRNWASPKCKLLLALPMLATAVTVCTAFFNDTAFSYSPDNIFVRGPLGFVPHGMLLLYLILILASTIKGFGTRRVFESLLIFSMVTLIIASVIIEAIWPIHSIGRAAMVLSTIFYYMFFQTQTYRETMTLEQKRSEHFEKKSQTDDATGLLNKNSFFHVVSAAMERHVDGGCALLLLDLDRFKDVNDRLGHLTGDKALCDTARKLKNSFRNVDFIGRFGGDEFCVFLPDITKEFLYRRLDEILPTLQGKYTNETDNIKTTVSIGAVYCAEPGRLDLTAMFQLADTALYQAKAEGRNRYAVKTCEDAEGRSAASGNARQHGGLPPREGH